ncbi:MAG: hypothetical protein GTN62_08930 [Gemmatimonadales bacterium]|nr:hypothetical protein [Gemmatimonadales bacterium]NIN11613.1 hypothetical protein [Gemmatimonadales bacterium]NIN50219.1 hypothetical protein [Gemmatimonadales bacterium]NIP07683.1 hypothetical protein [Gemmatimonadales bacterium]NIR01835.1 hypothetical protein [Gemmatimonadales bacterium]
MLRVDLRALHEGPIEITGVVAADDPLLDDLEFDLAEPVRVRGRLTDSGPGRYYWHGELGTEVAARCRRCLADVPVEISADVRVLFTDDSGADDPAAYIIEPRATELDLGEMVREELILAVPEFVLCREECRGLCPRCGKDLNEGPCTCRPELDPRWAALEELKQRWSKKKE